MVFYHVITNFEQVGGAEEMLIRYINSAPGHDHRIISLMNVSSLMSSKLKNNVPVTSLGATGLISLMFSVKKIKNLIEKNNNFKMYSWMYHANFIAALVLITSRCKFNLIWGVRHSLDDLQGERMSTKLAIYAGRLLKKIPSKVLYCSNKSLKQHVGFGYSTDSNSIYIPNGYTFSTNIRDRNINCREIVFGAAGRFHSAKNYEMLFSSLSSLLNNNKRFKLKVAGRGINNENETIQQYLSKYGIDRGQVELLDQINDMQSFYNEIDMFILTSKTEGFPNVLAEAMGSGCICFSTDVGDANLIVPDNERIVKVNDNEVMTKSIMNFIQLGNTVLNGIQKRDQNIVRSKYSIEEISKRISEI